MKSLTSGTPRLPGSTRTLRVGLSPALGVTALAGSTAAAARYQPIVFIGHQPDITGGGRD